MKNYIVKYTTQFKKDYKLAKRRGLNIKLLHRVKPWMTVIKIML